MNYFYKIDYTKNRMNNQELSYKLKYILTELNMNKTEFLNACRKFNPSISKPTILNAINGKNTITPTIETLSTIIKVCQTADNKKLQTISYDFLLNDNIKEIEATNSKIYQSIGLSDEVISRLKQYNHPFYYDYSSIINYYFTYIPVKYWRCLEMFKRSNDIKKNLENNNIKETLKLFNNDFYLTYIEKKFKNIYDLYNNLKNNKDKVDDQKVTKLKNLMDVIIKYLKCLLIEYNEDFYNLIAEK